MGSIMRNYIIRLMAVALFALPSGMPHAFAVSKEMIQLQTQVQQLQDMVQHLQTSNDERMGVLVNLVQQNTDNMNRMMTSVNALQTTLKADNDQRGASNTQLSTQIQSLNDSVDELKTRIANLSTQLQAIQSQMQNVNGMPAQPGGSTTGKPRSRRTGWGTDACAADAPGAPGRPALRKRSARLQLSQVHHRGL